MIQPLIEGNELAGASDEALMSAIKNRQPRALKELFERYGTTLKSMISHVVHEETEADDVLQETLLQVWREATAYSPLAGKPLGWVVTLTRRRAIDRLRRRQAYSRAKDRFAKHTEQEPKDRHHNNIEHEISRSDIRRFLQRQIKDLPTFQREAIHLSFFHGMTHREIAVLTGAPLGTVKTRLELGLRKLTHAIRPLRYKI